MGQIIHPHGWSGVRVVIVRWVLATTWVAVALLWTPTPPEPDPSDGENRVAWEAG